MSTWDAIVIGAGYIGCSISYYLSRAGLRVLLLDQGGIGVGASSANYGNIQVQDAELEVSLPMVLAGKACFNTLSEELESDLELRTLGCLLIAEPSCERRNEYLDRALVVPTVDAAGAEFYEA
ncbi:MAG: FAD-dependent oxidoreductase [Candidatus Promineifilaceae bacterium]